MKRPYMVEFLGTPEAGKTTVIKELIRSLSERGYTIHYVQESAEVVPSEFEKGSIEAHIWMRLNTARNIMFAKQLDVDIILIDRGIWDTLFWNYVFVERGELTKEKDKISKEFFKSINIFPQLTIILWAEVEEVIARRGGEGRIVTRDFIKSYNENLLKFRQKISPSPLIVNTTSKTQSEVFEQMESAILQHYSC